MKTTVLRCLLVAALAWFSGFAMPTPAFAVTQPLLPNVQPLEPRPAPVADDFSDADFEQADQPELGAKTGGDAGLGLVIFLLVVVLIVLLIYYLLERGHL